MYENNETIYNKYILCFICNIIKNIVSNKILPNHDGKEKHSNCQVRNCQ